MNDDILNRSLRSLKEDFDPFFHTRVVAQLEKRSSWFSLSWKSLVPSISLAAICLIWVVVQDGQLSVETVLGISNYSEELSDYLIYL